MPEGHETISRQSMVRTLAEVARQGGTVVQSDVIGQAQYAAIDSGKHGAIYNVEFPYYGRPVEVDSSLRMTGVMRRARLLRKFIECDPEDVKRGDKVVFENPQGEASMSHRIKKVLAFNATEPM